MPVDIGVILPTSTPDPAQPILGDIPASARFAEDAGIDSIWSTDHLVASAPMLDSTVVLSTAAAVTERITIGFNVMLIALRPVAWAAKQISTLQYVSDDRLVLGIGTGNPAHGDIGWRAAGVPYQGRGERTDAALEILPDLVTGRAAMVEDGVDVTLSPGSTMPPLLIAGNGAKAMRRAATYGDGWISLGTSPDDVAAAMAQLRELAAERGRSAPTATVVAPSLEPQPKHAADQIAEYADAGVQRVILAPSGADWARDYEFAATVRQSLA